MYKSYNHSLVGPIQVEVDLSVPGSLHNIRSVMESSPPVAHGGRWRPEGCTSRSRLAVVMTYRDRPDNLKRILQNLHPFLQRQLIEYQMFVIEPVSHQRWIVIVLATIMMLLCEIKL